ncbi:MAG: DUF29 domain-containing protein [Leptolyngbyaceae cyanobacterium bins.349]|nr:DUF29 domain-containing protein [Leptolyngbyaceae cyanobacterium bins.349]
MAETVVQSSLYEQDFVAWCEDTASKLRSRDFANLDFEALIEEIESLGRADKRELQSRLRVLLAHLLKRLYVTSPNDYRGWENTIAEQRSELELLLEQSPSLKNLFSQTFEASWQYSLQRIRRDYPETQFPDEWQFSRSVDVVLTEEFWLGGGAT